MKAKLLFSSLILLTLISARGQGTAFTYQGRLNDGAVPANGNYDLTFTLFGVNAGGVAVVGPATNSATTVSNGLFTVMIDFGPGVFMGGSNWMEIGVRTNGASVFSTLTPRQQLTSVPNAIFANTASNLSGTLPAAQLSGTIPAASLPNGIGGQNNNAGSGVHPVVGGGELNSISQDYSVIGGGYLNSINGNFATIGGGDNNVATGDAATVGGGEENSANSFDATVGGGLNNTAAGYTSIVAGGRNNSASGNYAVIGGGYNNKASGILATIGGGGGLLGGNNLNVASGDSSTVSGGSGNQATNSWATVAGGSYNVAGGQYSFAAGNQAQAIHNGAFVWSDSQNTGFSSTANDQFLIRAQGGVGINTNNPHGASLYVKGNRTNGWQNSVAFFENTNTGTNAAPALRVVCDGGTNMDGALSVSSNGKGLIAEFGNANTFVVAITNDGTIYSKGLALTSDRNAKENFTALDTKMVLAKIAAMPVTTWNYKDDSADKKHIGPVAQDFSAAFGLNGEDDRHISVVDESGVALAAIQGLNQKVDELKSALTRRDAENAELKQRLEKLEHSIKSLEPLGN